jgi:hypothetical protein
VIPCIRGPIIESAGEPGSEIGPKPPFAAEGIVDGPDQCYTGGQDGADQFGQEQSQGVQVPRGVAEEAMEPAPMPVANVAAGEDDLRQVAVAMRKHPAGDDLQEGLEGRGREDGSKML